MLTLSTILGYTFPEVKEGALDKPLPYQFYAGIELHPRLLISVNRCKKIIGVI